MYIKLPITTQDIQRARAFWASQKPRTAPYGIKELAAWVRASRKPVAAEGGGFCLAEFCLNGVPILMRQADSLPPAELSYAPIGIAAEAGLSEEGLVDAHHHPFNGPERKEAEAFIAKASLSELELRYRFPEPILYHLIPDFSHPDITWVEEEINDYARIHLEIVEVLERLGAASNDTLLDPACGEGQLAVRIIKKLGASMHLLDISSSNLNKTIANAASSAIPAEKLTVMQGPAQGIVPDRKYKFVILSGLLNRYVILNESDAREIIKNIADNCLEKNGFLIVTGHTLSIFCAREFEAMGFEVLQRINPSKNRALYVLRYKGNFHPLEEETAYFREMGMRKARMLEYGERLFVEMRRLTGRMLNVIKGGGRTSHERAKHLHAQLLRTTSLSLDNFFPNPVISYFFTITSSLTEQELADHLPGWTREMIFHYFITQQAQSA